jgi:hypothetical protein
LRVP